MNIGDRIKAKRNTLAYSQTELADKVGTTKQNIYKYEKGIVTNIPSDKLILLAQVLETTPAYLMGWDDTPQQKSAPEGAPEPTTRERKVTFLARKADQLTEEEYEEIVKHFNDTIDLYLRAKGLDIEDDVK